MRRKVTRHWTVLMYIEPSKEELERAHELFVEGELRDLFYRAATELVDLSFRNRSSLTVTEALAVLLQTWNRAYYQYHPAKPAHFADIEDLLARHRRVLARFRERSIDELEPRDEPKLGSIFNDFEHLLGPVGAAKALHLLAPRTFPLWDRAIAKAYGLALGLRGTNSTRYLSFMTTCRRQSHALGGEKGLGHNPLKALDEYNYCRFTKGWLE
jgi:hypothetical protein